MLIAFEGLDGCGKSTQIRMLQKYKMKDVLFTKEPFYFNNEIRHCLLHTRYASPAAHTLLFLACHAEALARIPKAKYVISDRSLYSSLAYTYGYNGNLLEKTKNMLRMLKIDTYPDIVFYLKMPVAMMYQRHKERGVPKDRIEKKDTSYFNRVASSFDNMSASPENGTRWIVIDASKPPSTIHDIVMKTLAKEIVR